MTGLQGKLDHIRTLLDQGGLFSLTAEEARALQGEVEELSRRLASIEGSYLTVGLLGGTGVGKSTIMNALAGAEIASTSHRRPHTDHVLIYKHAEAIPLASLEPKDFPWQEIIHHGDAIRQVLLCDMPDFDSLVGEHREQVLRFLEHLDILVWVTSPEKYADGRFYEFLLAVPKAKQNFYFLVNKTDLLFQGETVEAGYDRLALLTESFREHIRTQGIEDPFIYVVSAIEASRCERPAPWNQFPLFKQHLFHQRDHKQVTAIKAANLDAEVKQLGSTFEREVRNLRIFERILGQFLQNLELNRTQWVQDGTGAIDLWWGGRLRERLQLHWDVSSLLMGPGRSLALLFSEWRNRPLDSGDVYPNSAIFTPSKGTAQIFRRRLLWVEDQLSHLALQQNLPPSFRMRLEETLQANKSWEDLGDRFYSVVALHALKPPLPSFWGFKGVQIVTYVVLLLLFLIAIGGEAAWQDVLNSPQWASIFRLVLSVVHSLFSPRGLAALGSYVLLNLFFASRFYRQAKRLLNRRAENSIQSIRLGLRKVWEERLDAILEELKGLQEEILSRISQMTSLLEQ
jgi:GTP-binding protein EngB required for normal cell division